MTCREFSSPGFWWSSMSCWRICNQLAFHLKSGKFSVSISCCNNQTIIIKSLECSNWTRDVSYWELSDDSTGSPTVRQRSIGQISVGMISEVENSLSFPPGHPLKLRHRSLQPQRFTFRSQIRWSWHDGDSYLIINSTFLQLVDFVPQMSSLVGIVKAERSNVFRKESRLAGLNNYDVKDLSPFTTNQVWHSFIPILNKIELY